MLIPAFGANGLLPAFDSASPAHRASRSPHDASIVELVQRFSTSDERKRLLHNLIAYRQLLASGGFDTGFQFIDGSFVEDVETIRSRPPRDIDIMSFLVLPQRYINDLPAWLATGLPFWQDQVGNTVRNKARFELDAHAVLLQDTTYRHVTYWHGLFSLQRDTFAWKGYIAVPIDPHADGDALAALGSA